MQLVRWLGSALTHSRTLSAEAEARFIAGRAVLEVEYCGRFFVGESEAHSALYKLTELLDREGCRMLSSVSLLCSSMATGA